MGWRRIGNNLFYYRPVWNGGRPRNLYAGTGQVGELAALADQLKRAERALEKQALRDETDRLKRAAESLLDLDVIAGVAAGGRVRRPSGVDPPAAGAGPRRPPGRPEGSRDREEACHAAALATGGVAEAGRGWSAGAKCRRGWRAGGRQLSRS